MSSNGFYCGFNTPNAKTNENDKSLPEYAWRKAFQRDEYPACPRNWMQSEGTMASYFVGVPKGKGMWFDFNKNSEHSHDVAIVVSIQGINPITGLPCHDPNLEQYLETCPKCNKKFGANRHCDGCGYKWPKQNYIATTAQPNGQLWLDGFRTADGVVRQYIFTDDVMKGVAANIIGKDRVFAVGISFFISKDKKRVPVYSAMRGMDMSTNWISVQKCSSTDVLDMDLLGSSSSSSSSCSSTSSLSSAPQFYSPVHVPINWQIPPKKNATRSKMDADLSQALSQLAQTNNDPNLTITCSHTFDLKDLNAVGHIETSHIEVGAGTSIDQQIYDDPENLDYWREVPESMIIVNYALEDEVLKIIGAGRKEKTTKENGFLNGIPVGNK